MSIWTCSKCGYRYWDTHECPEDGETMLERIRELEEQVRDLNERVRELETK